MSQQTTNRYFDELARALASGSISRGKALRLMGAALVGGTLASLGIGQVAAADDECKPLEKKCRKNHQCCSGNCVDRKCAACPSGTSACGTQCCPSGETCLHGIACCPNAKVCGTGAFAICCKGEAQSCVEGLCQCNDPGTLPCAEQCVGCEGGTVNSETCLCECPSGTTLIGSTCCPNARVCGTGTSVTCCPEGQECGDGVCSQPCRANGEMCTSHDECCSDNCVSGTCSACPSGSTLCGGNCVTNCPSGRTLNANCECECTSGTTPCGTQCCQTTAETCVNGTCCPNARVCTIGTSVTCCPEGQECGDGACCISNGFDNTCTADTQCCSKICDFLRGRFFCSHCRSLGGLCIAGQCCPNLACENGRCCWDGFGFDCTDDSECCGSATCRDGQCLL